MTEYYKDNGDIIKCPVCGCTSLTKAGIKRDKQNYRCKKCKKDFRADTRLQLHRTNTTIKCPVCGSVSINRHGTYKGEQKYICRDCNKSFREHQVTYLHQQNTGITCPHCKSSHILKGGRQHKESYNEGYTFRCGDCKKKFTLYKKLTDEQKRLILNYAIGAGVSSRWIAKYLSISSVQIRAFIVNWTKENGYTYNKYKRKWEKSA